MTLKPAAPVMVTLCDAASQTTESCLHDVSKDDGPTGSGDEGPGDDEDDFEGNFEEVDDELKDPSYTPENEISSDEEGENV